MEFAEYVKEIFDANNYRLARNVNYSKEHPWYDPFTKILPSALKKIVDVLETAPLKNSYDYEGSIGAGRLADVFWFGCRHPHLAPTWQKGFYIVYLLSNDGTRLYLSLILGTEIVFSAEELAMKAEQLRGPKSLIISTLQANVAGVNGLDLRPFNFGQISLGGRSNLARAYEIANIFSIKYDSRVEIPSEAKLEENLGNFWAVYKRCLTLFGENVPNC